MASNFFNYNFNKVLSGRRQYRVVHKFGRNESVGTAFEPITLGGVYRTPQVANATTLRVKAGNAADTANGAGARTIRCEGIDANGDECIFDLTTNGESAGTASSESLIRLYRAYVLTSGTYATQSAGSHAAAITIENGSGGTDWLTIGATSFPKGQSEVACYTVPSGWNAYIFSQHVFVDSAKTAEIILFQRRSILQTAAPYDAIRAVSTYINTSGSFDINPDTPIGPFPAGTEADVSVDFEILLVKN